MLARILVLLFAACLRARLSRNNRLLLPLSLLLVLCLAPQDALCQGGDHYRPSLADAADNYFTYIYRDANGRLQATRLGPVRTATEIRTEVNHRFVDKTTLYPDPSRPESIMLRRQAIQHAVMRCGPVFLYAGSPRNALLAVYANRGGQPPVNQYWGGLDFETMVATGPPAPGIQGGSLSFVQLYWDGRRWVVDATMTHPSPYFSNQQATPDRNGFFQLQHLHDMPGQTLPDPDSLTPEQWDANVRLGPQVLSQIVYQDWIVGPAPGGGICICGHLDFGVQVVGTWRIAHLGPLPFRAIELRGEVRRPTWTEGGRDANLTRALNDRLDMLDFALTQNPVPPPGAFLLTAAKIEVFALLAAPACP